ncbi:MAG: cytidylate kinase-like family protein [Parasporobacterium sp.]|nr:cytidylate kinase-like family protein [Parasporobacterium sp.]
MKIITINREYGAGGHSVGNLVAEKLGIEIYDKDILRATAKEFGVDIETIEQTEETISLGDRIIHAITPMSYDQKDSMYQIQKKIVLELASKGPCVILGRCSSQILEEAGIETLKVFLYSDDVHRAITVGELINSNDPGEIQRAIRKEDSRRHSYYTFYTGKKWDDCHNYDLVLNTGMLGFDTAADIICKAVSE